MSRWILPVAVALTLACAAVSASGQAVAVAASIHPSQRHHSRTKHESAAQKWRAWCLTRRHCRHRHPWVKENNPKAAYNRWKRWCLHHPHCRRNNPQLLRVTYRLAGPVGDEIRGLPEGGWLTTFIQTAHDFHVSANVLMGIGLVESGGGVAGTAYMGCMDYSTFGSWPAQINCAARVLANYGLGGYNAANPSYPSIVMADADGIQIIKQ